MEGILQDLRHRILLLDKSSRDLKALEKKISIQSDEQRKVIRQFISEYNTDLDAVQREINSLQTHIKELGQGLKRKLSKGTFTQIKNQVDAWEPEKRLPRKELKSTFAHYAQHP